MLKVIKDAGHGGSDTAAKQAEVATTILAFAALALRQIEHPVKNGAKRQKSRK